MSTRNKAIGWVVALALLVWLTTRMFAWGGCAWYGYQTERDTRYAAFVGCMVKVGDNWFPKHELRIVQ
jgi:hypothetical protein